VQYTVATRGPFQLSAFAAGLTGIGALVLAARLLPHRAADDRPSGPAPAAGDPPGWLAVAPYVALILIVVAGELVSPVGRALDAVTIEVEFPATATAYGWRNPAAPGRTISVFGHPGAQIFYAAAVAYVLFARAGVFGSHSLARIARQTWTASWRPTAAILSLVGMAVLMAETGMTAALAGALAGAVGGAVPVLAPVLGAAGAFLTGSNTNSNVLFAPLQVETAGRIGANAAWLLAGQNLGGAVGSVFAPAKVIVGCSTVGLTSREEAEVLRTVLRLGAAIIAAGAAVVLLVA
jgi:lactate permease